MLPKNLRRTLMFASAIQVLGGRHTIAKILQQVVQSGDDEAWRMAKAAIEALPVDGRQGLIERYDQLSQHLPSEAFAV